MKLTTRFRENHLITTAVTHNCSVSLLVEIKRDRGDTGMNREECQRGFMRSNFS